MCVIWNDLSSLGIVQRLALHMGERFKQLRSIDLSIARSLQLVEAEKVLNAIGEGI